MKLVKQVPIMGHLVDVEYVDNVFEPEDDKPVFGLSIFAENKILIAKQMCGKKIPRSHQEHTLCHEIVHFWLFALNEHELCSNEKLVDTLGGLMHQFLKDY